MKFMKKIFISLLCLTFISTSAYAAFDRKSKVSSNDSTAGYLNGKLVSGSNTTIVENNDGGNETLQVNAIVSGSGVILDLADDASNESVALTEIATTGDTNSIFTEPSADKFLIDASLNWPSSDTADALSANGANCSTGESPEGVDAAGAVENCIDPILETELDTEAELETQLTDVTDVFTNNDGALNDDDLTNNNATDLSDVTVTTGAADQILIRNTGNTAFINKTMPNCDSVTDKLAYTQSGQTFTCITDQNASGTGYATIEDEGTPLTQRTVIDFQGSGVTCVDNAGGTTDCVFSSGGQVPVDLSNNAVDDIVALSRINTANDTNNIITNNVGDEVLIDMGQNWPTADSATSASTATALGANGANCSAGNYPLGVDASGAVETCTADDDVPEVGDLDAFVGNNHLTYDTGNDRLDLDAEVVNHIFSLAIFDPTTADTNKVQHKVPSAITITRVSCSTDVGTATIQLDERVEATPNTAGTDVMTSALVCNTTTATTTTFTNAGIVADVPVNLQITATASTPTIVRIHAEYTIDDV